MTQLLLKLAPSTVPLVSSIAVEVQSKCKQVLTVYKCPSEWAQFIKSLASTSPTCALLHPSETVASLVHSMIEKDITKDASLMLTLQEEIPVLFQLIRSLGYYPLNILAPLIEELWKKSNAPFMSQVSDDVNVTNNSIDSDLYYFPALPKVRSRDLYVADKKSNDSFCTKRSSKHRALLPGIFTLFCQHGMLLHVVYGGIEEVEYSYNYNIIIMVMTMCV